MLWRVLGFCAYLGSEQVACGRRYEVMGSESYSGLVQLWSRSRCLLQHTSSVLGCFNMRDVRFSCFSGSKTVPLFPSSSLCPSSSFKTASFCLIVLSKAATMHLLSYNKERTKRSWMCVSLDLFFYRNFLSATSTWKFVTSILIWKNLPKPAQYVTAAAL